MFSEGIFWTLAKLGLKCPEFDLDTPKPLSYTLSQKKAIFVNFSLPEGGLIYVSSFEAF